MWIRVITYVGMEGVHGCVCLCVSVCVCVLICVHVYVTLLEDLVSLGGRKDVMCTGEVYVMNMCAMCDSACLAIFV